jgi:Uma2 family endonuclease
MAITQRQLTLAEFLKLPELEPALEFHDGAVTQKMSPTGPHSVLQTDLATAFNLFAVPRRLGRALSEFRTIFAGSSFVPDVSIYRWERIPADEHGDIATYSLEPPDIAVEIISPGQTLKELVERCRWYVEHGVRAALLVHPRRRWVRIFRPGRELGPLKGSDRIDLGDALPGFELTVDELFRALRARPDWPTDGPRYSPPPARAGEP